MNKLFCFLKIICSYSYLLEARKLLYAYLILIFLKVSKEIINVILYFCIALTTVKFTYFLKIIQIEVLFLEMITY